MQITYSPDPLLFLFQFWINQNLWCNGSFLKIVILVQEVEGNVFRSYNEIMYRLVFIHKQENYITTHKCFFTVQDGNNNILNLWWFSVFYVSCGLALINTPLFLILLISNCFCLSLLLMAHGQSFGNILKNEPPIFYGFVLACTDLFIFSFCSPWLFLCCTWWFCYCLL